MLKEVFYLLIPENIKNIDIYKKVIDVFLEQIKDKCSLSLNINDIFRMYDPKYKVLFMQKYAKSFYEVLKTINTSNMVGAPELPGAINQYPAIPLSKMMTVDQIQAVRKFAENKGTKVGMEFVYNLIASLNTPVSPFKQIPFQMNNVGLFHYEIKGNLSEEIFEKYVKPLAHPVGFIYDYSQGGTEEEFLSDTYKFKVNYNVASCIVHYDFNEKNYSYKEAGYNVVDINHEIIPFVAIDYLNNELIQHKLLLRITFENGNYLEQLTHYTNTTVIEYNENDEVILDFTSIAQNVFVNLEYIEDDTYFPDNDFVNKIEYIPAKVMQNSFIDSNKLPIYGDLGLVYGAELIEDNDLIRGKYKFTYGQGTTKYTSETVTADEYINIRKFIKDDNLTFKVEKI
mgnify:FL=1